MNRNFGLLAACLVLACGKNEASGAGEPAGAGSGGASASGGAMPTGGRGTTGGSGATSGGGGTEGGTTSTGGAGAAGASGSGGSGPNIPERPTLLEPGDATLVDVTSDGYVIVIVNYGDRNDEPDEVKAIPMNGGPAVSIVTKPTIYTVQVRGRTVFIHDAETPSLTTWSADLGLHETARETAIYETAANSEGTRVLFTRRVNDVHVITGANADLTGMVDLGSASTTADCSNYLAFVGDRFIAPSCADGVVHSWDAEWNDTILFDGEIRDVLAHPAFGGRVFVATPGTVAWAPAGGGPPTILATQTSAGFAEFEVSPTGENVLVALPGIGNGPVVSLHHPVDSTPLPVMGLDVGVPNDLHFVRTSPDGNAIAHTGGVLSLPDQVNRPYMELGETDLTWVTSEGFTPDSRYALFTLRRGSDGWYALPLAGGEPTRLGAAGPTLGSSIMVGMYGLQGSRVIHVLYPELDLVVRDLDAPEALTKIASFVADRFLLVADERAVVYRVYIPDDPLDPRDAGADIVPGIYVAPVP